MSAPGFAADEAGLRRRGEAVAAVEARLREAVAATAVVSSPEAYGLLCSFFPTLLDPVQQQATAALARAADACREVVDDLGAAAVAFTGTDDTGADAIGGPGR